MAWLTLHWGILPRLDDWRPQIEARVSAAIGAPLRIGAIRVRSGSWIPAFELDDVRLLDRQGRVALQLGRVSAALSPASLLTLRPVFSQLHVDRVSLDVRRDSSGRFFVAGLGLDGAEPADPAAADWFFEQHELVIRHGTLRWTDEAFGAPPLQLADVDLVLRNGLRRHDLRIDATPPSDWGGRFALRGRFTQPLRARAGDWKQWSGTLYADLPQTDVSQLRRHVKLPFELAQGRGAVRTWLDITAGRPVQGTADLALTAVALQLAPDLPPLVLEQLRGRLSARRDVQGLDFGVEQLAFVSGDGVPWAPSTLRLSVRQAAAGTDGVAAPITGGSLNADWLELDPLARLATRLPLPAALHQALADLVPQGRVQGLAVEWTGSPDAPSAWRVRAQARSLALVAGAAGPPSDTGVPSPGRPGLSGADIDLDFSEAGGQAQLTLKDGTLVFPGVFDEPVVPLASFGAHLDWRLTPGVDNAPTAIALSVRDAVFANADAHGNLNATWQTGPGSGFGVGQRFPGHLDLSGRLAAGEAIRVVRYLPLGIPQSARSYVGRAVGPGHIAGADFQVRGDLWQFPYVDGVPGEFRIRAQVQDLRLAYVPSEPGWASPWPAMTAVGGEIEFNRATMHIRNARALLDGVTLRAVNGNIPDLGHKAQLQIDGQARGNAADLLRFVHASPVASWIGASLSETTASGPAELNLGLTIPLDDPERTQVRGALLLPGNDLRIAGGTPLLAQARGRIDFTQRGFSVSGGRARVLGGDTVIDGGLQPDGNLRLTAAGTATADALLRATDLPALAPLAALADRLHGQAPYRLQFTLVQGRPDWLLSSPLTGLALDLPAPLGKTAAVARQLIVAAGPVPSRPQADRWQFDIGDVLQARYEREPGAALRGSLGIGADAPPLPAAGVSALLRLTQLDVDAWRALLPKAQAGAVDGALLPTHAVLHTGELLAGGRRLSAVTLDLMRQPALSDTLWRAQVRADQVEGLVEWRQARDGAVPGRVMARLQRLTVPASDAGAVEEWLQAAPASVPALDLVIDDFHWRDKALGKVEVEAVNRASASRPGTREWQLDRLDMRAADARLQGTGVWSAGRRMALRFQLDLADSGAFAERMGAGPGLKGGKGRIEGDLSWAGSPLAPDAASMAGGFTIALEEGRFLNVEPGAARLLGVLSLQALPRRLLLDFRDVFQQGFAFDKVAGLVTLDDGIARTDNLRLVGVQAAVLIEGSADLKHETQDLRIVAVPEINTGAASLAYAAINPAIGLGTFLAQWLLREPMMAAATREFHVTGGWSDPKVERVERITPAAPPASAPQPGQKPP